MPIAFMNFCVRNPLSSSSVKPFVTKVHCFFTSWHTNVQSSLVTMDTTLSALISFVQHVKLFLEIEGIIVHLCGGLNVPNYW
jgi:hypothetical protein